MTPHKGESLKREEAIERLLYFVRNIRHHTIMRIKIRRKYVDLRQTSNLETDQLLEQAMSDFNDEIEFIRKYKERLEENLGQLIGPVEDYDGRRI